MQPLTNSNTKGITVKKIVDIIQKDLYDKMSKTTLVKIECNYDGVSVEKSDCSSNFIEIHYTVLKYFEYFSKYFEGKFKNEPIKFQFKPETVDYFKRILYRNEDIDVLIKTDIIELFVLMDFIAIPHVFIKYLFNVIDKKLEEEYVIFCISKVLEKGIKLPKTIVKKLIARCHEDRDKYINLVVKYFPEYAYELITELSKRDYKLYIESTYILKKNFDKNTFIKNDPCIKKIPVEYYPNIVWMDVITRYTTIMSSNKAQYIVVNFKDKNTMVKTYNYILSKLGKQCRFMFIFFDDDYNLCKKIEKTKYMNLNNATFNKRQYERH